MGIGISMSGLASAVANQGGVGVLSAAGIGLLARRAPRIPYGPTSICSKRKSPKPAR
jgi:NAD(P)H-dependent flavin oxidoreductase YrpB (nitropropane dioxygenase family)